ncbi:MAG: YgiT-type zinc finger protein [Candidatus Aminicenantes bacterium]|nr:YgiT-type zinc finger protein [Candidatus Aminicenantes bacterium]NIM81094.1 YgiT-type zinc finger protein [Candidatus Aminicenantes bacterium]NIN20468.1 YgiT-type zinc finger protein [Candidatus Aminicenantes bacterium]NIN44241.1 YgiT-type zinc finger protein [Candidatus Aminicenantes bacterium]NIN87060.1 YgiT-type zinc finger protein [Candidatus Aminicenantes bacterium]
MFRCNVCGSTKKKEDFVTEIFNIDGKPVMVENIPATICDRCGEETFSRETTERIRRMVHGEAKPKRSVSMDIFAYA